MWWLMNECGIGEMVVVLLDWGFVLDIHAGDSVGGRLDIDLWSPQTFQYLYSKCKI